MAVTRYDRRAVIIVVIFGAAVLSVLLSFQTCGEVAFFFVLIWLVVPFFLHYIYMQWRKGRH